MPVALDKQARVHMPHLPVALVVAVAVAAIAVAVAVAVVQEVLHQQLPAAILPVPQLALGQSKAALVALVVRAALLASTLVPMVALVVPVATPTPVHIQPPVLLQVLHLLPVPVAAAAVAALMAVAVAAAAVAAPQ